MTIKTYSIYLDPIWLDRGFQVKEMHDGRMVLTWFNQIRHTFEGYVTTNIANNKAEEIWNNE